MGHLECIDLLKLFLSNPDRLDPLLFQNGFSQRMKRGEHAGDEAQQESYKQPKPPSRATTGGKILPLGKSGEGKTNSSSLTSRGCKPRWSRKTKLSRA